MKAIFINGSPRKNKNTYKLVESAMKGAGGRCGNGAYTVIRL